MFQAAAVVEDLATAEVVAVDGEAVAATGADPPEPAVSIVYCIVYTVIVGGNTLNDLK